MRGLPCGVVSIGTRSTSVNNQHINALLYEESHESVSRSWTIQDSARVLITFCRTLLHNRYTDLPLNPRYIIVRIVVDMPQIKSIHIIRARTFLTNRTGTFSMAFRAPGSFADMRFRPTCQRFAILSTKQSGQPRAAVSAQVYECGRMLYRRTGSKRTAVACAEL